MINSPGPADFDILTNLPVLQLGDDAQKTAVFKNPRLRLLMNVVGFECLSHALDEEIGSTWIIPPRHSVEELDEYKDLICKAEFNPPMFEDGETAQEQVRRKAAPRKKVVYDDDDDDAGDFVDDGDDVLFPKNLPNKKLVGPDQDRSAKKRRVRRKRTPSGSGDENDELPSDEEEVRAEKARKRHKRELDKQRKIKSALYVSPSDDESDAEGDAEFFRREEEIRQRVTKALAFAPTDVTQLQESAVPTAAISEAIKRLMADSGDEAGKSSEEEEEEEDEDENAVGPSAKTKTAYKKRKSDVMRLDSDGDEDEEMSSPPAKKAAPAPRQKTRGGFLFDSSDEEEDEEMQDAAPTSPVHVSDNDEDDEDAGQGDSDGDEMQTDDTPLSSNPKRVDQGGDGEGERLPLRDKDLNTAPPTGLDSDEDGEDGVPVVTKRRPRMKAGFVMDDSDDE